MISSTQTSSNTDRFKDYDSEWELPVCDKCIPINIDKLRGAWTQVTGFYANLLFPLKTTCLP